MIRHSFAFSLFDGDYSLAGVESIYLAGQRYDLHPVKEPVGRVIADNYRRPLLCRGLDGLVKAIVSGVFGRSVFSAPKH